MADAQVAVYILSPPSASVDELANAFNSDLFHDVKVVSLSTPKGKDAATHQFTWVANDFRKRFARDQYLLLLSGQCAYTGNGDAMAYSIKKWIQQSDTYDVAVLGEGTSDQGLPNALLITPQGLDGITKALADQTDQPPKTFPDDPDLQAESQAIGQSPIDAVLLGRSNLRTVNTASPTLFTKVTSTVSDAAGLPTPYVEGAPSTTADEMGSAPSTAPGTAAEPGEIMSSWWFWLIILIILIVILGLAIGLYYRARRI